jgi:NADH-quinone oxidoreductase subunit K
MATRPLLTTNPPRRPDVLLAATWELTPTYYLILSAFVFSIGAVGLLVRRNPLIMFMCVELMLNAVNLTFVGLAWGLNDIGGQVAVFFVMVVAAAEVVVGLAIVVAIMRRREHATADDLSVLRG